MAPGTTPTALQQDIAEHFAIARRLFRDIYRFFVDEYSDANVVLGPGSDPDIATEIDGTDGHFVIHPDYAEPNSSAGESPGVKHTTTICTPNSVPPTTHP